MTNTMTNTMAGMTNSTNTGYKMKWHKFTIYFALFVAAISSAVSSISYFNGHIHTAINGSNIIYNSAEIYAQHPMMHTFDILFGVFSVLMAVFYIVTRFKLAGFKKNAPKLLYVALGVSSFISIAYALTSIIVLGFSMTHIITIIASAIIGIIEIAIFAVYYSKRSELFTN